MIEEETSAMNDPSNPNDASVAQFGSHLPPRRMDEAIAKPMPRAQNKPMPPSPLPQVSSLPSYNGDDLGQAEHQSHQSPVKKVGIIALIVALVAAGALAGYTFLFNGGHLPWTNDKTPLTQGQFATLVIETFPEETGAAPMPIADGKQNFSSCDAQHNVHEFALMRADPNQAQGISFRLFDTAAHAERYASQIRACWIEGGRSVPDFQPMSAKGVTYYTMRYDDQYTTYYAVYHNVVAFTNTPSKWEPFADLATGAFKNAVDKALLAAPLVTPTYAPPVVPPPAPTTAPQAPASTESVESDGTGGSEQPNEASASSADSGSEDGESASNEAEDGENP
ncbi:MAG: hypothetical protein LBM94_03900 [Propionibacteriaceae bacterium]|nr:hypothetical protein [Propionibacteriaceae bacterium]